jgi:glutamate carboxypeptidase
LSTAAADSRIAADAAEIAARGEAELERLVAISSPSGDVPGTEQAVALCAELLPSGATVQRPRSSSPDGAPDLLATVSGTGARRVLLLGHVDTVVGHEAHKAARIDGDRMYGPGTADMKGGVVLALGVARALARDPQSFAELAVLLVTDEEWRRVPFVHVPRFAGYDACLCFEAGERTDDGAAGVIVRRKAASTLRVSATGRASHSGSSPDQGRNALLALAWTAQTLAAMHDPHGPDNLSVVPTIMRSGDAFNVVPAAGELFLDLRARGLGAFDAVLAAVSPELDEVRLDARMERLWPGMDSEAATAALIASASQRLGRGIAAIGRGGASDASHFAASIALTIDGLGPRGGGAHTPQEFMVRESLRERAEVALAVALETLR